MKRFVGLIVLSFVFTASAAWAQGTPEQYRGALGFHNVEAPLGIRWWVSDKLAIDAAIGIGSDENPAVDENLSHWAIDLGLPILLKRFDRLNFMVRPGLMFQSQEVVVDPGPPVDTDNDNTMSIGAELEAEVFLTDHFTVSAAHGFAFVNNDPAVGSSTTDWGTTGANFTNIGFHVYLWR